MVYMQDRKDLFVSLCRYFDHRALSVQDARIHTTRHGWALDSFIVLLPAHDKDYRSNASLIEHELNAELRQAPSRAEHQLTPAKWRPGSRRPRVFPIVPNVEPHGRAACGESVGK